MSHILVVCENPACRTIFSVNNFFSGDGNSGLIINNVSLGPCPVCRSNGKIPNGEYFVEGDVLTRISNLPESIDVLKRLQSELKMALKDESNLATVLSTLTQIAPNYLLPKSVEKSKFDWPVWIQTLLALITVAILIQQSYLKKDKADDKFQEFLIKENKEYREKILRNFESNSSNSKNIPIQKNAIPALNKPCYCGSGKLFKRCHGIKKQ